MPDEVGSPGPALQRARILVLGLGNPILGDDGVGWRVAEEVRLALRDSGQGVEIDWVSLGGLSLMERILGYAYVIIIDSIETGRHPVGRVSSFPLEALDDRASGHTASAHDTSLLTALEAARAMGEPVPTSIEVVAVEARQTFDFSEQLTAEVEAAVPVATRKVMELIAQAP